MNKSCLYVGQVRHRRFTPKAHQFSYKLFLMYLDMSELPSVFDRFWLWSIEKANIASFYRKDHLGDKELPLEISVRNHIENHRHKVSASFSRTTRRLSRLLSS